MSLRDDLDLIDSFVWRVTPSEERAYAIAIGRLRAALTPAALKWLEALPELLEQRSMAIREPYPHGVELTHMLWKSIDEAAALHAAASAVSAGTDNKEQK